MQNKVIQEKVMNMFSTITDVDEIELKSELIEDLEISSMDVLFLVSSFEEEFGITILEKDMRKMVTVEDVVKIIENLKKV